MEDPSTKLDAITERIPGKSAAKNEWLEPIHALQYFQSFDKQLLPSNIGFQAYKYERHEKWAKAKMRNLEEYQPLPY